MWSTASPGGMSRLRSVPITSSKWHSVRCSGASRTQQTSGWLDCTKDDLAGDDADHNAAEIVKVFAGERSHHRDSLVLGASLALRLTGIEATESLSAAGEAIDDGRARTLLDSLATANV